MRVRLRFVFFTHRSNSNVSWPLGAGFISFKAKCAASLRDLFSLSIVVSIAANQCALVVRRVQLLKCNHKYMHTYTYNYIYKLIAMVRRHDRPEIWPRLCVVALTCRQQLKCCRCLHGRFKVMNFNEFSIASVDVF